MLFLADSGGRLLLDCVGAAEIERHAAEEPAVIGTWASGTFRSGEQEKLLIADNRTNAYLDAE